MVYYWGSTLKMKKVGVKKKADKWRVVVVDRMSNESRNDSVTFFNVKRVWFYPVSVFFGQPYFINQFFVRVRS